MTLRLKKNITDDERYRLWIRIIERIYSEQVNQAGSHSMFRLFTTVFDSNVTLLEKGGNFYTWVIRNYVDSTLMLIRRELDKQSGAENLRNLLIDIIDHPSVLTRVRYRMNWGEENPFDQQLADRTFNSFNPYKVQDNPDADYIDPQTVRDDLNQLITNAEALREFAERTRAHRTPNERVETSSITYAAMHKAIIDVRKVVGKYFAILTLKSIVQWEPVPQYDTIAVFTKPWVTDRQTVITALKKHKEEP